MVAVALPLTDGERDRIAAAIAAAESRTSGEIVVVVAQASHRYLFEPTLIAAVAALILPAVLWLPGFVRDVATVYAAQLATFLVLLGLLLWPSAARCLVSRSVQREHAERFAEEQFRALGLDRTREGTGIMIFLSLAERYVRVLADHGIAARVAPQTWTGIVESLTGAIRAGRMADGLAEAVEACGAVLAEHFPRAADDRNELPDRVVEV
ncbi:MAG: TPM domain-containing protein [Rhodospirillaceae bacterium]|nr:TPM domain-containing protein [Rhodospirillaceae bacterium]